MGERGEKSSTGQREARARVLSREELVAWGLGVRGGHGEGLGLL